MTREEILEALADGADLAGIDLSGADLSRRSLSECSVRDGRFDDVTAPRMSADLAIFERTSFRHADLSASNLRGSTFEQCDFSGARLAGASAANVTFRDCTFAGADLSGIYLQGATFIGPLGDACFAGAQLLNTTFDGPPPATGVATDDQLGVGSRVGPIRLDGEVAGAMTNAIYRGTTLISRPTHVLVTVGPRQRRPIAEVRADFYYAIDGVSSFVAVMEARSTSLVRHVLVEELPPGTPLAESAPLPESEVTSILRALAEITARAHADGWTIWGIHPRLCFARRAEGRVEVTGVAARAMRFLLGMPPPRGGFCLEPYLPFDVWRDGVAQPADDVFALCALGYFLATGDHPFPGPTFDAQLAAAAQWRLPRLPGRLGHVLARGLVRDREQRATAADLVAALASV